MHRISINLIVIVFDDNVHCIRLMFGLSSDFYVMLIEQYQLWSHSTHITCITIQWIWHLIRLKRLFHLAQPPNWYWMSSIDGNSYDSSQSSSIYSVIGMFFAATEAHMAFYSVAHSEKTWLYSVDRRKKHTNRAQLNSFERINGTQQWRAEYNSKLNWNMRRCEWRRRVQHTLYQCSLKFVKNLL